MTDFLNTYKTQPAELSVNEVAKILRCSNQMVFKLCLQYKDLSYYKVGNRYVYNTLSVTFFQKQIFGMQTVSLIENPLEVSVPK